MAVTRRVHRFEGGSHSTIPRASGSLLERALNEKLANGERIVGTHHINGDWIIITESFGLGPADKT